MTSSVRGRLTFSRRSLLKSAQLGLAYGAFASTARAAGAPATRRLAGDWEHFRGTLGGICEVWRGDKASDNVPWDKVAVPHCFNARDAVDPDGPYYQGHGWYRTRIKHSAAASGNRLLLHFEGAGQRSEVYVFMEKVGEHLGGYDEFTFDITDAVDRARKRGMDKDEIAIAVMCDNSRDLERIPSSLSDFVVYGGLYRHVSLVEVPAVSLARVLVDAAVERYSPSIWAGWYRGQYTEYRTSSEAEMKKVDHFFHAEWGGDSHAGRFAEDADRILSKIAIGGGTDERGLDYLLTGGQARASKDGDWSETYICSLFDWHLKEQEMPWLTGSAQWVFKDFATPLRPENPVPRVNQKGLVERDLTPKDGYFVFQSYWSDKPMVRIAGHNFAVRWGDKSEAKLVKVYSNCPEAELFLNGQSFGAKKRNAQDFPAAGLRWMAKFREGENRLEVRGRWAGGVEVKDAVSFRYQTAKWGKPARLILARVPSAKPAGSDPKAEEVVTVEARLVDGRGVACLDARNVVRFDLAGAGRLLDNLGTTTGSRKVELGNGRARISVALARDPAVISVATDGVNGALLTLTTAKVAGAGKGKKAG